MIGRAILDATGYAVDRRGVIERALIEAKTREIG